MKKRLMSGLLSLALILGLILSSGVTVKAAAYDLSSVAYISSLTFDYSKATQNTGNAYIPVKITVVDNTKSSGAYAGPTLSNIEYRKQSSAAGLVDSLTVTVNNGSRVYSNGYYTFEGGINLSKSYSNTSYDSTYYPYSYSVTVAGATYSYTAGTENPVANSSNRIDYLSVSGSSFDVTPPELTGITFYSNSVAAGGQISYGVSATDASPLGTINASFSLADGSSSISLYNTDLSKNTYSSLSIPATAKAGDYKLASVSISDVYGNTKYYTSTDIANSNYLKNIGFSVYSSAVDYNFTISGTTAKASIMNGNATFDAISAQTAKTLVTNSTNNTLVVNVTGTNQTVTSATFTKSTIAGFADAINETSSKANAAQIVLNGAQIKLDGTVLLQVARQATGSDVKVSVTTPAKTALTSTQQSGLTGKDVAKVISATIVSNNTQLTTFGSGTITLYTNFTVPSDKAAGNYKVYNVASDGKLTKHDCTINNGVLSFTTTHLSDYVLVYEPSTPTTGTPSVYRARHIQKLDNIFTNDAAEYSDFISKAGFQGEGPMGKSIDKSVTGAIPIYRLLAKDGTHFFTDDYNEYSVLVNQLKSHTFEKVSFYAYPASSTVGVAFYRLVSPTGKHFYTDNIVEVSALVSQSWKNEGVAFKLLPN